MTSTIRFSGIPRPNDVRIFLWCPPPKKRPHTRESDNLHRHGGRQLALQKDKPCIDFPLWHRGEQALAAALPPQNGSHCVRVCSCCVCHGGYNDLQLQRMTRSQSQNGWRGRQHGLGMKAKREPTGVLSLDKPMGRRGTSCQGGK